MKGAYVRRGVLLAVTAISLYLLAPALAEVFGAWRHLDRLSPIWLVVMLLLQVGSYACMWALQRLALRTDEWGPVVTSQLASNAFGRVIPGGVAAAGGMQYAMLARTGLPLTRVASGMTASSLLVLGMLLALPVLSLPAIIGGAPVNKGLVKAAIAGAGMFVVLFAAGAWCIFSDRPLLAAGRAAQALRNRLFRSRRPPTHRLPELLDYLTLLAALTALGAHPRPSLVLLAFCAAQFLGQLPLTPGGLGFVEAGLTGTLALAGVPAGKAVIATLAYRLVSFWLPIPAGGVAAILHRRHYGTLETPPSVGDGG
jgi:uncharacterized membrane protein YbhN (UPF0104 family)